MKPRLLDLFCGAGGCSRGYQADAMTFDLDGFDAIHASPPCQAYSAGKNMWKGRLADDRHPDLVDATRARLVAAGVPYVIENVEGAPPGGWTKGTGNFMQRRVHVAHEKAKVAMGIDWMTRDELSQAIPPAYTEWVGAHLLDALRAAA